MDFGLSLHIICDQQAFDKMEKNIKVSSHAVWGWSRIPEYWGLEVYKTELRLNPQLRHQAVCVCMCVCKREREREREGGGMKRIML